MEIHSLLQQLKLKQLKFQDVLDFIEQKFTYTASSFQNGNQSNASDQNQGSARVLFLAKMNSLSEEDTLTLFAEHYQDVLSQPEGTNHANIRQFIENGWGGVSFEKDVLAYK